MRSIKALNIRLKTCTEICAYRKAIEKNTCTNLLNCISRYDVSPSRWPYKTKKNEQKSIFTLKL